MQTQYELNLKNRLLEDEMEYENRLQRLEYLNKYFDEIFSRQKAIEKSFNDLANTEELNTIKKFLQLTRIFGTVDIDSSSIGDNHVKKLVETFKSLPKYKTILELDEELKECKRTIEETRKQITNAKKELCSTNHILFYQNGNFVCKKCNLVFFHDDYHHLCGRVLVYNSSEKKPRNLVLSQVYHEFHNKKEEEKYSQEFMDIVTVGIKEDKDVYAIRKLIRKKYFKRK